MTTLQNTQKTINGEITISYENFEFNVTYTYYPPIPARGPVFNPVTANLIDPGEPATPADIEFNPVEFETFEDIVRYNFPFEIFIHLPNYDHVRDINDELKLYHKFINDEAFKLFRYAGQMCYKDVKQKISIGPDDRELDDDYGPELSGDF